MSTTLSDPRLFFAAERTLLAWLRTGLTIMALGFVISRFGLFIRLLSLQAHGTASTQWPVSAILGATFVVIGAISILAAAVQHKRFISTLPKADFPHSYSTVFALAISFIVGVLGLSLAGYLLLSNP